MFVGQLRFGCSDGWVSSLPAAILGNYMESGWFICIAIYSGCIEIVKWKLDNYQVNMDQDAGRGRQAGCKTGGGYSEEEQAWK